MRQISCQLFCHRRLCADSRRHRQQVAHLALVAVYLACFRDYTPYLAAGEVATVAIICVNRMQARSIFRYTLGLLEAVPVLQKMVKDDTADQIVLNNRVVIEIHTASFRVTRGYTLAAVLADETAFWRDESSSEL